MTLARCSDFQGSSMRLKVLGKSGMFRWHAGHQEVHLMRGVGGLQTPWHAHNVTGPNRRPLLCLLQPLGLIAAFLLAG